MREYSLEEAAEILDKPASSLRRSCNSETGVPGSFQVAWGKRVKWKLTQGSIDYLLSQKEQYQYDDLFREWQAALRNGYITSKRNPASEDTVTNYGWGMSYLWQYSSTKKTLENICFNTIEKAILNIPFNKASETDGFAKKDLIYRAIRSFYKFLITKGLKTQQDLDALNRLRPTRSFKPKVKVIKINHLEKLVQISDNQHKGRKDVDFQREYTKTILYLMSYAGLRRSEVLNLKLDDIDLENSEISVLGKGNKRDRVGICGELVRQLKIWLKYRPDDINAPQLLLNKAGRPLTKDAIRHRLKRLGIKADVKFSPHSLRRFCATFLADNGVPISHIQTNLRHENIQTTMLYIKTDVEDALNSIKNANFTVKEPEKDKESKKKPKSKRKKYV